MADYTNLCHTLRTKAFGTIKLPDGTIQYADIAAADVIEQLQAESHNLQIHADYCESERDAYKAENERLKKKLDAAVADMKIIMSGHHANCELCYYDNKNRDKCVAVDYNCKECTADCKCKGCSGDSDWKWRGED